jgi:RHS repeat-associated protein
MSTHQSSLLCHYRYDPLDRLTGQTQPDTPAHQRFYCKSRLATEIQGPSHHSIVQYDNLLLAQQQRQGDNRDALLLSTDLQRSVLHTLKANQPVQHNAFTPYGHHFAENGLTRLLGFNGERVDPVTGCYLLGNGHRAFNPVLMRFNSPDSLSPFGKGGLNWYAYCLGDPINLLDSDGRAASVVLRIALRWRDLAKTKAIVKAGSNSAVMKKLDILKNKGSIEFANKYVPHARLKPGVDAMKAIPEVSEMAYRGSHRRAMNIMFASDLKMAKQDIKFLKNNPGALSHQKDYLQLLNYIKGGKKDRASVFSFERLFDAKKGKYDPAVSVENLPSTREASDYYERISKASIPNGGIFDQEYERLMDVYFIRG